MYRNKCLPEDVGKSFGLASFMPDKGVMVMNIFEVVAISRGGRGVP